MITSLKWKHFPHYWSFVKGIHWSQVNSPHKGQWHGALMLSLICTWKNGWVNKRHAGDVRNHVADCDITVMVQSPRVITIQLNLSVSSAKWWFNTLRPRQNGRDFSDDIFRRFFLNKNIWIPIKISLKFVPKGSINNIPALVQIMAWRRPGDKPLSEPMMVNLPTHICVTRPQWVKHAFIALWIIGLPNFQYLLAALL